MEFRLGARRPAIDPGCGRYMGFHLYPGSAGSRQEGSTGLTSEVASCKGLGDKRDDKAWAGGLVEGWSTCLEKAVDQGVTAAVGLLGTVLRYDQNGVRGSGDGFKFDMRVSSCCFGRTKRRTGVDRPPAKVGLDLH